MVYIADDDASRVNFGEGYGGISGCVYSAMIYDNASISRFAACRSAVPNPSVNGS